MKLYWPVQLTNWIPISLKWSKLSFIKSSWILIASILIDRVQFFWLSGEFQQQVEFNQVNWNWRRTIGLLFDAEPPEEEEEKEEEEVKKKKCFFTTIQV